MANFNVSVDETVNKVTVDESTQSLIVRGVGAQGPAGTTDHGALTGLADDDHTQYLNTSRADTWLATKTTSNLTEGSNLYFTDERAQDAVGSALADSSTVDLTYNDGSNTISASVIQAGLDHGSIGGLSDDDHTQYHNDSRANTWLGTKSTSDLAEGSNLYFTNERVDDRVNSLLVAGSNISLSYNDLANTLTISSSGGGGGGSSDSFQTIQTDTGTYPAASSPLDTLILTTDDTAAYSFDGDSTTDTVSLIIEDASETNRGLMNTQSQTFNGFKTFSNDVTNTPLNYAFKIQTNDFLTGNISNANTISFLNQLTLNDDFDRSNWVAIATLSGVAHNSNGDVSTILGEYANVVLNGSGTVDAAIGVNSVLEVNNAGVTILESVGYQSSIDVNDGLVANARGLNVEINDNGGTINYAYGVSISALSGTNQIGMHIIDTNFGNSTSLTGVFVDLSQSTSTNRKIGYYSNDGALSINGNYETQSNLFVDTINGISGSLTISNGTPISNTDVFMTNLPGLLVANDDFAIGPLGIGFTAVGFVSQFEIASGKTVDRMTGALGGFAVGPGSTGGTVTNSVCFDAFGTINMGGGTVNITNAYAYKIDSKFLDYSPTNPFGFYSNFAGINHLLGGDAIGIGGTTLGDFWKFDNLNQTTDIVVDHVLENAEKLKTLNYVSTINTNGATSTLGFVNAVFEAEITGNDDISGSSDSVGGISASLNISGNANVPATYGSFSVSEIQGNGDSPLIVGASAQANSSGDGDIDSLFGVNAQANATGAGNVPYIAGIFATSENTDATTTLHAGAAGEANFYGAGTQSSLTGVYGIANNQSNGTITSAEGYRAKVYNDGAGSITNAYGFIVESLDGTTKYGFHNTLTNQGVKNLFTETKINEIYVDNPAGVSFTVDHSDTITGNISNSFTSASNINLQLNGSFDRANSFGIGQNINVNLYDDSDISYLVSALNQATHQGDGVVGTLAGVIGGVYLDSAGGGSVTVAAGVNATVEAISGTISTGVGVSSEILESGGSITTGYAFRCENIQATTKYGIYIDVSDADNFLSGGLEVDGRFRTNQGSNIAAANDLTLGSDGNVFTITGNTTINAIISTGWQNGSSVTLKFTGTPTVKHNTAGGAGTAVIMLAGSIDLSAADDTILGLTLIDGEWQETFRKVA